MTLLHATSSTHLTQASRKSTTELAARERVWNEQQRQLQAAHDERKSTKAHNEHAYQARTLQHCKKWGGPCITLDDLNEALLKADDEEFCITQEIIYYRLTHPTEHNQNPHKFRVRKISLEEKLQNLREILEGEEDMDETRNRVGRLPTNSDVLNMLQVRQATELTSKANH